MGSKDGLKHGDGSVWQRGDNGRWQGAVIGPNGKRHYVSAATEGQAVRAVNRLRKRLEGGEILAGPRITVGRLLTEWLEQIVLPNRSPNTYALYTSIVRNHLEPELGRIPLEKLRLPAVQGFLARKTEKGYAPKTIGLMRSILITALRYGERADLIDRNVARLSEAPKVPKTDFNALGPEELPAFLELVRDHPFGPLFAFLAGTGLRIGEALGLTWAAVDLERRILTVAQQLDFREARFVFAPTKVDASQGEVSLPRFVVSALRTQSARQAAARLAAGPGWNAADLVFCDGLGRPFHEGAPRAAFKALMKRAGYGDWTLHELRHTYATLLKAQGVDPGTMRDLLRHSSVKTTLDLYPRTLPASKRAAADALDAILGA